MINQNLLLSGKDIPFKECNLLVRQPSIEEICLIGNDEEIFTLLDLINFSKNKLKIQDKTSLESVSDFNIFMTIIQKDKDTQSIKNRFLLLLEILFPNNKSIAILPNSIIIIDDDDDFHTIDENNFENFKDILNSIFNLTRFLGKEAEYNPANDTAAKIAEKIKRGKARVAAQKKADGEVLDVFQRYVSIVSIGLRIDIKTILSYTPYQLFTSFDRLEKQEAYQTYLKAQMAGATGLKEVKHWMQ